MSIIKLTLFLSLFLSYCAGRRDDRPDQCIRRCPRPNQDTLVCVFDGVRNRTLPSECILERIECISGRRNMEITDGPCPDDVALYMNGMLSMETESEEDSSEESREDGSTPGKSWQPFCFYQQMQINACRVRAV